MFIRIIRITNYNLKLKSLLLRRKIMFITRRASWPVTLITIGAMLALALSLSLAVPKAGAVTIEELLVQIQALQAQLVQLQAAQGTGTATACTFTKNLYPGVSDPQVKCLQQYLNAAGYTVALSGAGSVGNETNYYGSLTRAAVKKWQDANNVAYGAYWGYFGPVSQAKYTAVAGTTGGTTGGTVIIPPAAGGLSVALSATTPASRSIVVGAANMPFGKWVFTAGSGNVTVTTLKFTRSGISADAEVSNAELYDVATGEYISQYTGLGSGVLTFANSGGLFTVNAGQSREVELRLKNSGSNNHTMVWSLNAAADVASNATSVSGNFPMASNGMTFVSVTDPAVATLTMTRPATGNSVNAGTTGYLAGSFTLASANSAVLLDRIVLTQNGSIISGTDVTNIKLVTTGGQQLGQVLPNLKADGSGTFVMSPAYEIPSGQTIQVNVYADVIAGVNRTMIFNVLNTRDVQARDKTYNVGIAPSGTGAMTTTNVGAGTLTITLDPSSPTGNVAPAQTNITVAKFKVVAYGEQIKVLYIPFQLQMTGALVFTSEVDNVYMVDDAGNQIGTTITTPCGTVATTGTCNAGTTAGTWNNAGSTAATFGTSSSNINYLIPANTTRIWSLKLDLVSGGVATDIKGSLVAGTDNYQGQISNVSTGDTTAVGGNTLTITSNPFQAKQNTSVGPGNLIRGQSNARIGSFILSASSAEGINVSTITLTSSTTFPFANLILKVNGVQFGDIKGSTAVSTNYTFSGSAPILIPAGGSVTVDAYVDILTAAVNGGSYWYIELTGASAVGATTATSQTLKNTSNTAISTTTVIKGQYYIINTDGGTLTIAKDSSSPAAYQAIMGQTGKTLAIWRFSGGLVSDISITDIIVTDIATSTAEPTNAKASLMNLQWYKGGVAINPIIVSGTASTTAAINPLVTVGYKYTFHFTSPIIVPQNDGISLELRGSIPTFASGGSESNQTHTLRIENPVDVTALSTSGSLAVVVSGPNHSTGTAVNAVTVLRTKLTVTAPTGLVTTSAHPRSSNDTIAYFDFTADSANSIVINTVTMKMGGATLATLTIKLIDADTGTTWQSVPSGGIVLGVYTTTGLNNVSYGTSSVSFNPAYTLTAGATKRVKVVADTTGLTSTSGSTSGSVIQMSIDTDTTGANSYVDVGGTQAVGNCRNTATFATCNALGWNDGSSGSLNLEAKVLPIYAPAISY